MSACYTPPPPFRARKLNWRGRGFENFDLYVHDTIGDGHCLLHTIMCGIHVPYRLGVKDGILFDRSVEMRRIRTKMAEGLETTDSDDIPHYFKIGDGALADFGSSIPEFLLDNIKNTLNSSAYLGNEHIIIISYFLKISIYVLDSSLRDIYCMDQLPDSSRSSIVALYTEKPVPHYELVSIKSDTEQKYDTHFAPDHGFIQFLRFRMLSLKK